MTKVETARLLLRPWQASDLAEFTRLLTDPAVTRYIVVHTPFSPDDVAELSARTLEQWDRNGFGPWAAIEKATGRWVGRIGLDELLCATGSRRSVWSGSSAPPWPPTPPPGG
jgi:RimJ/RimL family protein N-acetyltransferase